MICFLECLKTVDKEIFYVFVDASITDCWVCLPLQPPEEHDPQSQLHLEREWRFERNSRVRREAAKQQAKTG